MTREQLTAEQEIIAQRRHEAILILADRHPEKIGHKDRYRVLVCSSAGKKLSADDLKLVRFETEFRDAFETGQYSDQGFFDDLIAQAKRDIKR